VYNQKFILIIGAMRGGKSYFANKLIEQYNALGWGAIVYNLGRGTDFAAAREVFGMSTNEHLKLLDKKQKQAYKENPFLFLYSNTQGDKLYKWEDINKPKEKGGIIGQPIKMAKLDPLSERLFFETFYQHAANTLLVLDDMKGTFRHGLKAEFLEFFSRINHAGRKSAAVNWRGHGASVAIILHSLDDINDDLFTYVTHIVNFKYAFPPDFRRIQNPIIRQELEKSFVYLQNAPQYTHTLTDVQAGTTAAQLPNKTEYQNF
jgi:hypothetical protein